MPDPTFSGADLRAVVLDLDGTLYRQAPVRRAMALRLARAHSLRPLAGLRTMRHLSAYRKAQEQLRLASESLPKADLAEAQVRLACERTGASVAQMVESVDRWMERAPLDLLPRHIQPGLVEFLDTCRRARLRLALLSDYPAEAKLQALGVQDYFELVLTAQSPAVGRFKPDPRGLLVILEQLGVPPSAALYVGDRPEVDAAAAQAAGVACCILGSEAPTNGGWTSISGFVDLQRALFGDAEQRGRPAQPVLHLG